MRMNTRLRKLEFVASGLRPAPAVAVLFHDCAWRLVCARLTDGRVVSAEEAEVLPRVAWCKAVGGIDPLVVLGERSESDPAFSG